MRRDWSSLGRFDISETIRTAVVDPIAKVRAWQAYANLVTRIRMIERSAGFIGR